MMILLAVMAIAGAAEFQLSPDGNFAGRSSSSRIVVRNIHTKSEIALGAGTHPRFSPDSKRIAFLRDGRVWSAAAGSLPAAALSPAGKVVSAFDWLGTTALLLLEKGKLESFDIGTGEVRDVSEDRVLDFEASPDGRWVAAVHEPGQVFLHNLERRIATRVFLEAPGVPGPIRWAPDSSGIYAAESSRLLWFSLREGEAEEVDLDWPAGLGADFAPVRDGVIAILRGSQCLALYGREEESEREKDEDGSGRRWLRGPRAAGISQIAASADGKTIAWFGRAWSIGRSVTSRRCRAAVVPGKSKPGVRNDPPR